MSEEFKDLKVGDDVFIVYQRDRYAVKNNEPHKTEVQKITKKGTKYLYIKEGHSRLRFDFSGVSNHGKEGNARVNGFGFDVYFSEEDYLNKEHILNRNKELCDRIKDLTGMFGRGIDLPPSKVESILNILDE